MGGWVGEMSVIQASKREGLSSIPPNPPTHPPTGVVAHAGQILAALLHQGTNQVLRNAAKPKPPHAQLAPYLGW